MGKLRLTKAIKDWIIVFKKEENYEKNCEREFKNELFAYLHPRDKKIYRNDVVRWCKSHSWILELEDDDELLASRNHPRKRSNLSTGASNSYGVSNRRGTTHGQESREDEGNLPTTVGNEVASFKREVEDTPRNSSDNQGAHHIPPEIRQSSGNDIGQNEGNSDESTETVYHGQGEGRGGNVRQSELPLTQTPNESKSIAENNPGSLPLQIIRPVAIYAYPMLRPSCERRAPTDQVEAAGTPLVQDHPDSSGRMPSLSPQVPVSQIPSTFEQPPSSSVRNQSHMDQEKPSGSKNQNFNQPPPDESEFDYDPRYLSSFHEAFVSVRSLTDLCITCPYLRQGLLHLEKFTDLLSRINKKITMPKTYREAVRAQLKHIKQERVDLHKNYATDNETGSDDEGTEDSVIETGRVTTTAQKRKRCHCLPTLINLEDS